MFAEFMPHSEVKLVGVEAAGDGIETGRHSATLSAGRPGVLHGMRSYVLQNESGQVIETHSISAGLDYPSVGPEHAHLKDTGRAQYVSVTDREALDAFSRLCRTEGIIPALESSHAIAYLEHLKGTLTRDQHVVVCLSGRGDKDLQTVLDALATRPSESTP
jgi:tryptophan synthase beta chain